MNNDELQMTIKKKIRKIIRNKDLLINLLLLEIKMKKKKRKIKKKKKKTKFINSNLYNKYNLFCSLKLCLLNISLKNIFLTNNGNWAQSI